MDLRQLVRVVRRQGVAVLAAVIIGACLGAIVGMLTPQRFEASVQLMVTVNAGEMATPAELAQSSAYTQQVIESYRSVLTSSLVLHPVIDDLGLERSTAQLADAVRTRVGTPGAIITATVQDVNPGQAARIANAIGNSFSTVIADELERRDQVTVYSVRVVTVQPATVPTAPAAPNLILLIALGALMGLGGGSAIVVLREAIDRRIRTTEDVERAVPAPVLGGIALDPAVRERPLVVAQELHDPRAEAFRSVRTNVRFLFPLDETGVFVVTSAGPSEGKSTTAANVAIAFSESGLRVALVDADLRKPRLAGLFGVEGAVGLTDVLIGRVRAHDVMQRWGRGALFLLPAGTVPPNPAELLGSDAMAALIDDLKAAFDVVIVDTPPVLPVTDAAVVARRATGVLLVAAAGATASDHLATAAGRIEAADARVLGTVVTMLPTRGADKSAYGAYGYGAITRT